MKVKVEESETEWQSEDFRAWIRAHEDDIFYVQDIKTGNDGKNVYILAKVPFHISARFCKEII